VARQPPRVARPSGGVKMPGLRMDPSGFGKKAAPKRR
jgi:hypothetical protein